MNSFPIGARVELWTCPNFPGSVTGFVHGRVQVLFDDFKEQPPKAFRPESLQPAKKDLPNVPKTVASGTGSHARASFEESTAWRAPSAEPFGTGVEVVL
jgi:hypothetical protein